MGLVRFELTIDGSLRHASVLQRVIIFSSVDPLFIICEHKERKDRWSPSPFRARPQPRAVHVQDYPAADSINSQYTNLRVWLSAFFFNPFLHLTHSVNLAIDQRKRTRMMFSYFKDFLHCFFLTAPQPV